MNTQGDKCQLERLILRIPSGIQLECRLPKRTPYGTWNAEITNSEERLFF